MVLALTAAMIPPAGAQAGGPLNITGFVGERTGLFPGAGQPLAGASVQLLQNDVEVDSDTTNASGNYTVLAPVGQLEVVASKAGYVTQCRKVTQNGNPVTPPPIELPTPAQAGSLSGAVTDSFTHNPIQDVTVEVSYDQGCDPAAPPTTTGSNGGYVFASSSLPGPEHLVTFSKPGYNSLTQAATVFGGGTVLSPELDPVDTTDSDDEDQVGQRPRPQGHRQVQGRTTRHRRAAGSTSRVSSTAWGAMSASRRGPSTISTRASTR